MIFGNDTEKILSDNINNFNINTTGDINKIPTTGYNINIPVDIGVTFRYDTQQNNSD